MIDFDDHDLATSLSAYLEGYATYSRTEQPGQTSQSQPRATHWLGIFAAGAATLVVVAGTIELANALHNRSSQGMSPITSGHPPVSSTSSTAPLSASLPSWMGACVNTAGISFSATPPGDSPTRTSSQVVAAVRATESMPATPPITAFLQFAATGQVGTKEATLLSQPVWAVGFNGLNYPPDGQGIGPGNPPPSQRITGRIFFVSDSDDSLVLSIECSSSP